MKTTFDTHQKSQRLVTALALLALLAGAPLLKSTAVACGGYYSADDGLIAHEWGTFTSIQGGDGVLLDWNGIATADLPPFVYDWSRAGLQRFSSSYLLKGGLMAKQRMETPVIYFYTQKPVTVDVAVEFPKGTITEWFPQAAEVGPSFRTTSPLVAKIDNAATRAGLNTNPTLATRLSEAPVTNSIIRWQSFEILPAQQNAGLDKQLPTSAQSSHYFAARVTDAAFVRAASLERTNPAPEVEKFLFYRGVGNFPSPLKVTVSEQGVMSLLNTGDETLTHLFAVEIRGDRATVKPLGNLATNQTLTARLDETAGKPAAGVVTELRRQMADALESEGLYRAEAEAMVNTWRDAWFEDQGVRILYLLPRKWTDATLPLTMSPQPKELVRVMVGRAEVITPTMAQQITRCVEGFRQPDSTAKQTALREFRAMKLGRFAHTALRVAATRVKEDGKFYEDGSRLIEAAQKPAAASAAAEPARRLAATGG